MDCVCWSMLVRLSVFFQMFSCDFRCFPVISGVF
nr:MAG TPA: hypothetical protein [Caudoviricetes sp.]